MAKFRANPSTGLMNTQVGAGFIVLIGHAQATQHHSSSASLEPVHDLDQGRAGNCSCVSGISCILQVTVQGEMIRKNAAYTSVREYFSDHFNAAMRPSAGS